MRLDTVLEDWKCVVGHCPFGTFHITLGTLQFWLIDLLRLVCNLVCHYHVIIIITLLVATVVGTPETGLPVREN